MSRKMEDNENENNETAIKEVQRLIKNGVNELTPDLINKLRDKYSDNNIVDAIMDFFTERRKKINKVASIYINAFEQKYNNIFYSMSLSKFMKKTLKYAKRYNLSDDEINEIKHVFESKIYNLGDKNSIIYPNTNLSKVLGYPITESRDKIKPSNTEDYAYLQDILRIYEMFKSIHSYIVIQTMTYSENAEEVENSIFNIEKHDKNRYVHAVIVALFVPKINSIEERMLYANIAGIVNTKYLGNRILTRPDYELFYSLVVDPTDVVCDDISPIRDLKSRAEVQVQLWNNVYNLRAGKVYDAAVFELISYIDKCRVTNVDNPDLVYLSDEGIILRRLFNIFAYRPITIRAIPLMITPVIYNQLNIQYNFSDITTIPYIIYRIPPKFDSTTELNITDNNLINFYLDSVTQQYVPKKIEIYLVNGPLIYYVPRKIVGLPIGLVTPQIGPFVGYNKLETSYRHYQKINRTRIKFEDNINNILEHDSKKTFKLKSFVYFKIFKDDSNDIFIGHETCIYKSDTDYLLYKPTTPINSKPFYKPSESHDVIIREGSFASEIEVAESETKTEPLSLENYFDKFSILVYNEYIETLDEF